MLNWKSVESAILTFCFLGIGFSAVGQSMSYQDYVNGSLDKYIVQDAQVGSLICEDASGNLVLCSCSIEETILGITTSIPYVSINKPLSPEANKYIFEALVSNAKGELHKGDLLTVYAGGLLAKSNVGDVTVAIALDEFQSKLGKMRVKWVLR